MNVTLAAFHLVQDYPCGAVALGPMLNKSPATLSHEVKPNYPGAKLGVEDAVKLTILSGDYRILNAFAMQCDAMVIRLSCAGNFDGGMQAVSALAKEFSDLVSSITAAVGDDDVTPNELRRVEEEASHLVACVQRALQHVNALATKTRELRVEATQR